MVKEPLNVQIVMGQVKRNAAGAGEQAKKTAQTATDMVPPESMIITLANIMMRPAMIATALVKRIVAVAMAQAQNIATNAIPAGLSVTSVAVKEESNVTSVMLKPHWYAQTAMGKGEDNLSLY